jgi:hypothetical protein
MKKIISTLFAQAMMVIAIFVCNPVNAARPDIGLGGEHFQVYLNDKLILEQGITASFKAKNLPLDNATASDKLVIHYRQCHGLIAKGRSLSIKDENGKTLKEWKFADSKESAMVIPVKEILQLQKQYANSTFKLYYTSTEYSEDRTLASLQMKSDKTALN